MATTDFRFGFVVMAPVGQHVTLRFLERVVFDADGEIEGHVPMAQPLVRHDETGIVFCLPQLVPWVDPRELKLVPPGGGHRSTDRLVHGRVVACVVGNRPGDDTGAMDTRLVVETNVATDGYR